MDRRAKVELFEQMRREYEFGIGTILGVAQKFGCHRRLVRQAIESAIPPERKSRPRECPRLGPVKPFIDAILEADRRAPRKQRHTAHRIWVRLCQEQPQLPVAESTVRAYVRQRKQELGLSERQTCVPQVYDWGEEAQADWYEAYADLAGERVKVQVFALRSMKSAAAFHRAYLRATQQAFFEAHEHAFAYFGGVFRRLRYDNLGSAVKKVLRGHTREEHTRFIAFRSHWQFEALFCSPAQPQEKGGVEGEVGTFRRNYLVPVPAVADLEALNGHLLLACQAEQTRLVGERQQSVGALLLLERAHLLALPQEGFELWEVRSCVVDGLGCVKALTNRYSTPLRPGARAEVRVLPSSVEVWQAGKKVACHARSYARGEQILDLEHYLDVLERKPGALPGSKPLAQWRERGLWPESFDRLLFSLQQRLGPQAGIRAMVELLQLGRTHGYGALRQAVEKALSLGCSDAGAIRYLLLHPHPETPTVSLSQEALGELCRYERPLPEMAGYDLLLEGRP